jgi:hypothetical protein
VFNLHAHSNESSGALPGLEDERNCTPLEALELLSAAACRRLRTARSASNFFKLLL